MEAKFKVHEHDFERVIAIRNKFQNLQFDKCLYTDGYYPKAKPQRLSYFSDVQIFVPCLAGARFTKQHIDMCGSQGIIPVYPSGVSYVAGPVEKISEILSKLKV